MGNDNKIGRVRAARLIAITRELEKIVPRGPDMDDGVYAAMIKRIAMSRLVDEELRQRFP